MKVRVFKKYLENYEMSEPMALSIVYYNLIYVILERAYLLNFLVILLFFSLFLMIEKCLIIQCELIFLKANDSDFNQCYFFPFYFFYFLPCINKWSKKIYPSKKLIID
jgi:hypothetical protein